MYVQVRMSLRRPNVLPTSPKMALHESWPRPVEAEEDPVRRRRRAVQTHLVDQALQHVADVHERPARSATSDRGERETDHEVIHERESVVHVAERDLVPAIFDHAFGPRYPA